MKNFIRTATFVFITVTIVLKIADYFSIGDTKTYILFLLLLSLLNLFKGFLLDMLSLPSKGPGYWTISFVLTLIVVNLFFSLFNDISINSVELPSLIIFGFVIPSLALTKLWSVVVSTLMISLLMNYFEWLCRKK